MKRATDSLSTNTPAKQAFRAKSKAGEVCTAGPRPGTLRKPSGEVVEIPPGWELLLPGDAALTRRVKLAGPHWLLVERRGRRTFSRGLYAARATIEQLRDALEAERASEEYARKREAGVRRRKRAQAAYVEDFRGAVLAYLAFHERYAELAERLADRVTAHATPVGSGTVARTKLIPIERRAEAAVIAWMRHATTAYDWMPIGRAKGERREMRRQLAAHSKELLGRYRRGLAADERCPLQRALAR